MQSRRKMPRVAHVVELPVVYEIAISVLMMGSFMRLAYDLEESDIKCEANTNGEREEELGIAENQNFAWKNRNIKIRGLGFRSDLQIIMVTQLSLEMRGK